MAYPEPVNMTGFVEMFQYANEVTDNYFVLMLLLSLYIIVFTYVLFRNYKWEAAGMAAGFITTITAILLRVAEILTVERVLFYCVAGIIIPLVFSFLRDSSS